MPNTKTKAKTAAKTDKAPKPFVHVHADANVSTKHYAGISTYINANRKTRVATGGAHKYLRTTSQLTPRTIGALRAMRDAYGTKQFQARGFDNAVLAMLISAGLLNVVSSTGNTITDSGVTFSTDGEKPLMLSVTKAGQSFGKA